jgi:hypothetical protein
MEGLDNLFVAPAFVRSIVCVSLAGAAGLLRKSQIARFSFPPCRFLVLRQTQPLLGAEASSTPRSIGTKMLTVCRNFSQTPPTARDPQDAV